MHYCALFFFFFCCVQFKMYDSLWQRIENWGLWCWRQVVMLGVGEMWVILAEIWPGTELTYEKEYICMLLTAKIVHDNCLIHFVGGTTHAR